MTPAPRRRLPRRIECVLSDVARKHEVGVTEVLAGCQRRDVSRARREVICRLWGMQFDLSAIARHLGVHHTTVIYALKVGGVRVPEVGGFDPDEPDLSGEWAI